MRKMVFFAVAAVAILFAGSAMAADGAALYASKCAMCHGKEGAGSAMGPAFKGSEFLKKTADADIKKVITAGRAVADKKYPKIAGAMPAQKVEGADLDAIVKYIKGL